MVRSTQKRFNQATDMQMQNFYGTLGEKNQRRYVALQSPQLGPGVAVLIALLNFMRQIK